MLRHCSEKENEVKMPEPRDAPNALANEYECSLIMRPIAGRHDPKLGTNKYKKTKGGSSARPIRKNQR